MAARLTVEITASEAKFREDLNKAVGHAERASKQIEGTFRGIKFGAIGAAIGLAVGELVSNIKEIIAEAAKLDDLADATGSTVENLSRLNNQAKISGTSFETLSGLVLKLSAGMAGADDESSNVGRALKALGVTAKDPAEALQQVAIALDKYADGVGKAAIARDLFGKGGPAFLATLKDIAQTQDVAATVTTKQAQEAEELGKAFRRLSYEATTFKDAILSGIVPSLNTAIESMREGTRIAGGFLQALANFGTINPLNTVAENLVETQRRIAEVTAGSGSAEARWVNALGVSDKVLDGLKKREEFLKFQQRQQAGAFAAGLGDLGDQVSRRFQTKPTLDYTGMKERATGGGRAAKADKDRISDAQRYLDALEQQLSRTQELTTVERVLADVESGRLKLSSDVSLQSILSIAALIDKNNELKKSMEAVAKQEQESARIREQTSKATTRAQEQAGAEVDRLAEQNESLREEISLIGAAASASAELEKARIGRTIALKQETAAMLENAGGSEAEVSLIRQQIALLKERQQLIDQRSTAEQIAKDLETIADYNKLFTDSFADSVSGFVNGSLTISQAVKRMGRSISDSISDIASRKLSDALFGGLLGGNSPGGGIGGILAKLFGDVGGGSSFAGLFSGFGFASGGSPPVGKLSLVGERGPELFVPKTPGTIIPNEALRSGRLGGNVIHLNVNVLPGASRATADQAAMQSGIAVQRALARNG